MSTHHVGQQLKLRGMGLAAAKRNADLAEARLYLVKLAQGINCREVTAEHAAQFNLGNAAGSLFKTEEWEWTGRFKESTVPSRHNGMIRVWRLK